MHLYKKKKKKFLNNHKICLHNEESNPAVRTRLSLKPVRGDTSFVSCSLLDNSGFEKEDDGRESKRHELHDESSKSLFASLAPIKLKNKQNCCF